MKKLLAVFAVLFVSAAFASDFQAPQANGTDTIEVMMEIDGQIQPIQVAEGDYVDLLNHSFYECRYVGDGWRRCSKRNGRCFGASFPTRRVCESVLHPDDD
ncbi:MAG: hypothetical protein HRT45_05280 [Bdellovibrionales bacterium]|nr:hypothetical protein [Bdellovibrionales bacterium]